jgi:hypothetical protein
MEDDFVGFLRTRRFPQEGEPSLTHITSSQVSVISLSSDCLDRRALDVMRRDIKSRRRIFGPLKLSVVRDNLFTVSAKGRLLTINFVDETGIVLSTTRTNEAEAAGRDVLEMAEDFAECVAIAMSGVKLGAAG